MSVLTCRSNLLRGARELSKKRPTEALYNYVGGTSGAWQVTEMTARCGDPLQNITHVDCINGPLIHTPHGTSWVLSGLVRNTRYVTREDANWGDSRRRSFQPVSATCAALIPIRRSPQWWTLGHAAQRELLDSRAFHLSSGLQYLSGIVRRWQHRWDLTEQFDGVTWFEYEPQDSAAFDDLLAGWRASEEWSYIDRECDIRLIRATR